MAVLQAHGGRVEGLSPPAAGTQARQERDFDDLYASTFQKLTLQLYAYTGDLPEAQDMVQEAFYRAYLRWASISMYDDPFAWVRRVAWNLAISRFRRQKLAAAFLRKQRVDNVDGPSPDRVALTRALATLSEPQRRAVVLRYMAQMTVPEIAAQEGVPEGTVKSWLSRGRSALASKLTDEAQEVDQ